jgi:hypothetical protein
MNDESERNSKEQMVASAEAHCEGGEGSSINAETSLRPEFPPLRPLEPTRYGDWEKAGRCIDF